MDKPSDDPPPPPDNGKAWLFWCIATIVLPAIAGAISFMSEVGSGVALFLAFAAFIMHYVISMKLYCMNGCAHFFVYVCGWALMLVSFFVGCIARIP